MDVGRLISIRRIEEQPVWSGRSGPQNRWQRSQCTRLPAESARDNPGLANAEDFLRAAAAARDRGMHRFPGLRRCAKNLLDQTPFGFGKTIASWVLNGRTRFCFAQGLCPRRSPRAPPAPGILGIGNCPAKSYHTPLTREAGLVQRLGHHPPPGFWAAGCMPSSGTPLPEPPPRFLSASQPRLVPRFRDLAGLPDEGCNLPGRSL